MYVPTRCTLHVTEGCTQGIGTRAEAGLRGDLYFTLLVRAAFPVGALWFVVIVSRLTHECGTQPSTWTGALASAAGIHNESKQAALARSAAGIHNESKQAALARMHAAVPPIIARAVRPSSVPLVACAVRPSSAPLVACMIDKSRAALTEGRLSDAIDGYSRALNWMHLQSFPNNPEPLAVAAVLEDLGWAKLRMAELELGIAALEAVSTPIEPVRVGGAAHIETGPEMLLRARQIRMSHGQQFHVQMANCCIRLAEYYWVLDSFPEIIALYAEALACYEANGLEYSDEAVTLLAWLALAHSFASEPSAAAQCIERALDSSRIAHGDELSWDRFWLLLDQAHLLQELAAFVGALAPQSDEACWAADSRKKTGARLRALHGMLSERQIPDSTPSQLAIFAPTRRQTARISCLLSIFEDSEEEDEHGGYKADGSADIDVRPKSEEGTNATWRKSDVAEASTSLDPFAGLHGASMMGQVGAALP